MYSVENGVITRDDGVVIPVDISAVPYQQYLYWQQHGIYVGPEIVANAPVEEAAGGIPAWFSAKAE